MSATTQNDLSKRLGALIGARRQRLGLSQEELVQRAKISRSYYSDIERGLRNMSVQSLCNIAQALGTTGYQLLHEAEDGDGHHSDGHHTDGTTGGA